MCAYDMHVCTCACMCISVCARVHKFVWLCIGIPNMHKINLPWRHITTVNTFGATAEAKFR